MPQLAKSSGDRCSSSQPFCDAELDGLADHLVRLAERHSAANQICGARQRVHESAAGGLLHARVVEGHACHEAGRYLHHARHLLGGGEDRLLRLLHVLVVGQRKSLHRDEQRRRVGEDPGRLAANQLQRIRILLLRHGAAAGRELLRQLHEAELGGREQNRLLRPTAQMQRNRRQRLHELDGEIAIAGRVNAVGGRRIELQRLRDTCAIERQDRPSHCSRAQRTLIQPLAAIGQPSQVAQEHLDVRQQPMRHQHWFGTLQMRVRRHRGIAGLLRLVHELAPPIRRAAAKSHRSARARTAADRSRSARCGCGRCAACSPTSPAISTSRFST